MNCLIQNNIYWASVVVCLIGCGILAYGKRRVTVGDVVTGIIVSLIPVINTLMAIYAILIGVMFTIYTIIRHPIWKKEIRKPKRNNIKLCNLDKEN